ncbi:serine/threonine-protein kinase [Streptomyces qinzhouensis]|uniref:non-specific serine/threonine protein kinase n=1 Tax=Streptomyces qinzhouensis TaxID=2599401 RepID=A0A5B8J5F9_9ACTN|nr:serine/threonine-protein kinase [Streptomyces qinzhouensis]QDY76517.1 protein kinase [Streptomyces qinzhouensis]
MNSAGDVVDGRFELIERLGSGGMGTVWRARDTVLDREVALKAVRSDRDTSDSVRERVLREARALARLSHPHVVTVHHVVSVEPHPWIVMEFVPGVSLQERLADGPLTPAETARIGRQLLSALRAAHAAGIHHRDVKPSNVLLRPDGGAVLTDFGIAGLQGTGTLTRTGELIGSPEYMAPERIRGADDDPSADLWSLGLVMFESVEGVSPMRRSNTLATLLAVVDDPVPAADRSGPLGPVLDALLVRDASARPDAERLDALLAPVESWTGEAGPAATTVVVPPAAAAAAAGSPGGEPTRSPELSAPTTISTPAAPDGASRSRPSVLLAVVSALVAAGTATAMIMMLGKPGDSTNGSAPSPNAAQGPVPSQSVRPPAAVPPPTGRASSAAPPVRATVTVTASADIPLGREENVGGELTPPEDGTPPVADPGDRPSGRWIAQLHSEPMAAGIAERDRRLAEIRATVPDAEYVRSDDYASLRPGFWVLYAPGPFADGRAALAYCEERGRQECLGRYLSTSGDDYGLQCRLPAAKPRGTCTRR